MSFLLEINHDLKVIRHKKSDLISKEDIDKAWDYFSSNPEFINGSYNLLSDHTSGKFIFNKSEYHAGIKRIQKFKNTLKGKKHAIIIDEPFSTAIAMLYGIEAYEKFSLKVEIFISEKAATYWLKYG